VYRRLHPDRTLELDDWMHRPESAYHNLQWLATGERLTRATFLKHRRQGGNVITFNHTRT
jgi:hypothetical protein